MNAACKSLLTVTALATACLATSYAVLADPRAGTEKPKSGSYGTDWGKAEFESDGRAGANATFRFADGHVVWGYYLSTSGSGTPWELVGKYIIKPRGHGIVPRPLSPAVRCPGKVRYLPDRLEVPDSNIWGSIRLSFDTTGTRIIGNVAPCSETPPPATPYTPPELTGSYQPTTYTLKPIVLPPPGVVKSKNFDGPCNSVSRVAIAKMSPCSWPVDGGFTLTMTKTPRKPIRSVVLTPLSDNWEEVGLALQEDRVLPRHPTATPIIVDVTGVRPFRNGDSTVIRPPASACAHFFWAVTLRDETDNYPNHGIVLAECARASIAPSPVEK